MYNNKGLSLIELTIVTAMVNITALVCFSYFSKFNRLAQSKLNESASITEVKKTKDNLVRIFQKRQISLDNGFRIDDCSISNKAAGANCLRILHPNQTKTMETVVTTRCVPTNLDPVPPEKINTLKVSMSGLSCNLACPAGKSSVMTIRHYPDVEDDSTFVEKTFPSVSKWGPRYIPAICFEQTPENLIVTIDYLVVSPASSEARKFQETVFIPKNHKGIQWQ